jgi:adenylate cyclase
LGYIEDAFSIAEGYPMKRKIAAIVAADIAGYSTLVAEDEEETLRRLTSYRAVIDDFIAKSSGRIFNTAGDAVLAEFPSAVEAVRCAIDIQESLRTRNLAYPRSRQMNFRIGVTIGDVVERDGDLLGDGVNIAARLEGLAQPGGICVSRAVYEQVLNKLSVRFKDIGDQEVKNIPTPVHAYVVRMWEEHAARSWRRKAAHSAGRMWPAAVIAIAGAITLAAYVYAPVVWFTQGDVGLRLGPPVSASKQEPPRQGVQKQAELLVPENVPLISDRERIQLRAAYLLAQDHKAIAISQRRMGLTTGQPDEQTAKVAALSACRAGNQDKLAVGCELYAVGNKVIWSHGLPPMPPPPWVVHTSSVEKPFVTAEVPLLGPAERRQLELAFVKGRNPKALALSPGHWAAKAGGSVDEAIRRALEQCGILSGVPCKIVAVNDAFVVPIPTLMKATGFFLPGVTDAIAPERRENLSLRLANATTGWNVVAIGSGGRPGLMIGAQTEQSAIDGALEDCGRQDRECRIIAVGPFLVERLSSTAEAKESGQTPLSGQKAP